jgi:hypothetical protein
MGDFPKLLFDFALFIGELGFVGVLLKLASAADGTDLATGLDPIGGWLCQLHDATEKRTRPLISYLDVGLFAWEHVLDENDAAVIFADPKAFKGEVDATEPDGFRLEKSGH